MCLASRAMHTVLDVVNNDILSSYQNHLPKCILEFYFPFSQSNCSSDSWSILLLITSVKFFYLSHFQFMSPIYREIPINSMTPHFIVGDFYQFLLLYFQVVIQPLSFSGLVFSVLARASHVLSVLYLSHCFFNENIKTRLAKKLSPRNSTSKIPLI